MYSLVEITLRSTADVTVICQSLSKQILWCIDEAEAQGYIDIFPFFQRMNGNKEMRWFRTG